MVTRPSTPRTVSTPPKIVPRTTVSIPSNVKRSLGIKRISSEIKYLRILLSALSGQGKTAFIGTASHVLIDSTEPCNVLDISLDPDGEATIRSMGVAVEILDRSNIKDHNSIINILKQLNSKEFDQYSVVALDPYNKLQEIEEPAIIARGVADAQRHNRTHDDEIYELRDYGRLYKRCSLVNQLLLGLKKHVIVTCIAATKDHPLDIHKEEDKRRKITSLALDGKMAHLLSADFSIHGFMSKEGFGTNIKTVTTLSQFQGEAKTRYRLPNTVDNLTFPMLLELLHMDTSDYSDIEFILDTMGFLATTR